MNIAELKKQTIEAIQKGKIEAALSEQEKAARLAAENAKTVAEAEAIIATIPLKCQAAAGGKKSRALIMMEKNYSNYKSDFVNGKWTAKITGGPGSLVIDACQKAGLRVDVQHQHDGGGMESWAEVYVSWD